VKDVIKSIPSSFKQKRKQKNVFNFFRFAIILALFVVIYMNIFKHLMSEERGVSGISWVESFYWVLTTMSTLGYGDITFSGDSGRLFSMLVMFTGVCIHGIPLQTIHGISNRFSSTTKI
jgi:hypothetical protein